jgi:hypothetical protein
MIKQKLIIALLFTVLAFDISINADAQYRQRNERRARRQYSGENAARFNYPPSTIRPHYRIDILVSMYLDELVNKRSVTFKDKLPEKASTGLAFYEGVTIAADSLKKAGYNIDIYVHDITSAEESVDVLIKKKIIDSADLIIGAVQPSDIPALAYYTKEKKINFISAMSPADAGVIRDKYLTILQPTLKTHCESLIKNVAGKYPHTRITLLYRDATPLDENAYKLTTDQDAIRYRQHNCNELPTKSELARLFDTTVPNIVVIPILDVVYADSLLRKLSKYFPSTHFEIYGMPTWVGIGDLRKENIFPNLTVNVTTAFSMDANAPNARYVSRTYRTLYGSKATEATFHGYEITMWYATLLKRYGTLFNTNYADNAAAPFTKYEIMPQWDDDGHALYNENKHIVLSRYQAGLNSTE